MSVHLRCGLIRVMTFGGSDLIRGMTFGGSGLIRGMTFGGNGLIRGMAFGGSGLIRGEVLWYYCNITFYLTVSSNSAGHVTLTMECENICIQPIVIFVY